MRFKISSVSFILAFVFISECHEWSMGVPAIPAYLRCGPRTCFRSECWIGGESTWSFPLHPPISTEHEAA